MPTIKDVAHHCGVSIATVSAVINDADWVPHSTRALVMEAIRALNYRPNRLAQSLKTRRSFTVGVIVSDITNPFYTDIVRSLSRSEEQTSELQSRENLVCRLLLERKR